MNERTGEMIERTAGLPDTVEDLAKFLLIAPVKAAAIKEEIRTLKNLNIAGEVYDQKLREQRVLAELVLDAKTKVGELTMKIPKATPQNNPSGLSLPQIDSAVDLGSTIEFQRPKSEIVNDLGFSQKQVERFEALARNKDIVEQVKDEARENNTAPTATRVLDLAKARKPQSENTTRDSYREIDRNFDNLKIFRNALSNPALYGILDKEHEILPSVVEADGNFSDTIKDIDQYIQILQTIKSKLISLKGGRK